MFVVKDRVVLPGDRRLNPDALVVDVSRRASLKFMTGLGPGGETAYLLHWEDRIIPLEVRRQFVAEDKPHGYYLSEFISIGRSTTLRSRFGIVDYQFASEQEVLDVTKIAAEALIIFGSMYNGDTKLDGYDRVSIRGEIVTKKSFGY